MGLLWLIGDVDRHFDGVGGGKGQFAVGLGNGKGEIGC